MMQNRFLVLIYIFLIALAVYLPSRAVISDSRWVIETSLSIIRERNTDLNEYADLIRQNDYLEVRVIDNKFYSAFPIGTSIIALPFVFFLSIFTGLAESARVSIPQSDSHYIAAVIVATTAVFIYLIGMLTFTKQRYGMLLAFIFAFCTSAWSTAALALWQHGPLMLMLTLALYLILLAERRPAMIKYAAIPLAFSFLVRPTAAIAIFFLTIYVAIRYRAQLLGYLIASGTIFLLFLLYNFHVYGSWMSPYYRPGRLGTGSFFEALAGNLVSPARGILIFSPIFLLVVVGVVCRFRSGQFQMLDYFLLAVIISFWLFMSFYNEQWWAGHSFGPRFLTDIVPFLMYFLIPAIVFVSRQQGWRQAVMIAAVACLIGVSFFIHLRGATSLEVQRWNTTPDVNVNQGRLWDWGDLSFLRGL